MSGLGATLTLDADEFSAKAKRAAKLAKKLVKALEALDETEIVVNVVSGDARRTR